MSVDLWKIRVNTVDGDDGDYKCWLIEWCKYVFCILMCVM